MGIFAAFGIGGSHWCATCVLFRVTSLPTVPTGASVVTVGSPGISLGNVRPRGAAAFKKRQSLEEQKFRLLQEQERLTLEIEIAKSKAKEQV